MVDQLPLDDRQLTARPVARSATVRRQASGVSDEPHVEVAVDSAGPVAGLDSAGRPAAQCHLPSRQHGMQERQLEQVKAMQEAQNDYVRSVAAGSSKSAADQIASAKGLLDSGAITQAKFEQLKARVLTA
jgi:hypothetical protein